MYAGIRQGKAKPGMAEEIARTIKEGAIPIISDVPGFRAYYVIYAPDDTVTAISVFDNYEGATEFEPARFGLERADPRPVDDRNGDCLRRTGDRAYDSLTPRIRPFGSKTSGEMRTSLRLGSHRYM